VTRPSIGVAVIGAGMAGRAHAAGYRSATTLYDDLLPPVRLVAIADVNDAFAEDAAGRFGYERAETSWQAIAAAPDIDIVSVVVANPLHREIVEGLLDAGKHVLCEKPLAPSVEDAEAMVAAAAASPQETAVGFTFRRSPAINAIRDRLGDPGIGAPLHFNGHYWCDYACDPSGPMSWRYKGGPGSGALADIGSHLIDCAEFLCGPIQSVRGAVLSTFISERALPRGAAVGHAAAALSDVREPVDNEDLVTFTATFASGATATLSASRVAYGLPNSLGFEIFTEDGAASFDLARAGEFRFIDGKAAGATQGYRQGARRPRPPIHHARARDGLPERQLRPKRPLRLPGPLLPRAGRGRGGRPALHDLRARPAQPATARRRRHVRTRRRRRGHRPHLHHDREGLT
jgi:predicted dehydrogenase